VEVRLKYGEKRVQRLSNKIGWKLVPGWFLTGLIWFKKRLNFLGILKGRNRKYGLKNALISVVTNN
jgi:hypothetical protein